LVIGVIASLYLVVSCERRAIKQPAEIPSTSSTYSGPIRDDLRDGLRVAGSDHEKWLLTTRLVESFLRSTSSKRSYGAWIKWAITKELPNGFSATCLADFPNVVEHLTFSVDDLREIGRHIGSKTVSDFERGGEPDEGTQASRWVQRLTGIEFASEGEFQSWLASHRAGLVWDSRAGRFVYLSATSAVR
jgi:hypothetical protein